ncbi:Uncharacterised protein [Chlamydia abortus]|uniref:DUF1232 domain-containing protein n=1 Tax=Paenibacillus residui TaxID=629724 RepID=A0ABW3D9Z6_9BACL|nr:MULTISPECIES: hypothetical protein [Paenibacillaceae]SHE09967.1 Uncharacterised protein [Chlamydia abortus]
MRKLLSLKHWSHVFRKVYRLLAASQVPLRVKLLFLIPVLLYWVLPDVLPFMPLDDIAVTMLAANWFADRIGSKYLGPDKTE